MPMKIPKIFIIGAGNVGGACAAAMAARRLGQIYLYDVVPDLAAGKAMDINHATPFFHSDCRVVGCNDMEELVGSDVVVLTAGAPRRAGMTRRDLLNENLPAVLELGRQVAARSPEAKVLVVTNPADILTCILKQRLGQLNAFGLGCSLDMVRLRFYLAEAAGASVESVSALVIGSHDDNMIPLVKHATIGGVGVGHLLGEAEIQRVVDKTRNAGNEIVGKLKTRGSFYAASHTVGEIVEAVVRNTRGVFPLSVYCTGQYGYRDTCLALPCLVGANGVEEVLEIALDPDERAALDICASSTAQAAGQYAGRGNRPAE
jgi:malate dehydrogenase